MNSRRKVLIVGGLDRSLLNFRGALIRDIIAQGHTVATAAPLEHPDVPIDLAAMGVGFCPIKLNRTSLNPFGEWCSHRSMEAAIRRERPDVILAYTIKPVLHAMRAGRRLGIGARFALITGLGAAFHSQGLKGRLMARFATMLYRRALRHCTMVFVQNQDIARFFLRNGIVRDEGCITTVRGSGVDVHHFDVQPFNEGPPCFLFLGRLLRDKGVVELVEAARCVRERIPKARVLLVGELDTNPAAITKAELQSWQREGVVEHRRFMTDVRPVLRECNIFVLPSYHEGMPRSVLEAMASGRPVITTDTIGCRDTVFGLRPPGPGAAFQIGCNGLLVPVRSADALAAAMLRLAEDRDLAMAMGRRGRQLAVEHFDVQQVNAEMLRVMQLCSPGALVRS